MDYHVKEFYQQTSDEFPRGNFHKVIILHEVADLGWDAISKMVPDLCKGWYELAHLSPWDRIEFTRDFWLAKLPYHNRLQDFVLPFFDELDSISVFLVQKKFDDPFVAHLVYSLKNDIGFFRGNSPMTEQQLVSLKQAFPDHILPDDYLAFLQIHDGFCKATDCTGIISSKLIEEQYNEFQEMLVKQERMVTTVKGLPVNPSALIPFYESFGMPFFQCFWGEWYPEQEMGNVYYSGIANTISDIPSGGDSFSEMMAFPTFIDWLIFYLEKIE